MGIQAVVFDAGGVLELSGDGYDMAEWAAIAGLPTEEFSDRIEGVFDGAGTGTVTLAQVHRRLGDSLGIDQRRVEAIMEALWRVYLGVPNTELTQWARQLRPRYKTGLLSNSAVGAREREHAAYGYGDLFDDLVYSHEVGLLKPDPRIYALACERLGAQPGEVVFLDDREVNIASAREAGLRAVLFEGETVARANERAIAEITALLRELYGLGERNPASGTQRAKLTGQELPGQELTGQDSQRDAGDRP